MSFPKIGLRILISVLCLMPGQSTLDAAGQTVEKEEVFINVLKGAYQASCDDIDRLRDYYLSDAEIVHDGHQTTLTETINELKRSLGPFKDLTCVYQPKVRASRIRAEIAYLVVRETIRISSPTLGEEESRQVCTYIFLKEGSQWKIAHDHCSTIPGETV